ncbi:MAG: acetate--CoA ligase family protein [Nocardioidaceae bacterium]
MSRRENLRRLLAPRTVAVIGGSSAEAAIEQCRSVGFDGEIWPVHPTRTHLAGLACYPSVDALPGPPDAAFVSVSRERTIDVVGELEAIGSAGVVCHASGFAEDGEHGARLQADLVSACGEMALIGPNCQGFLNYLDGVALWPEQHGCGRVDSGVGIIAQSGNIAENLTMQRRSLPVAQVVTIGNAAVTGMVELIDAMLTDPRITAIGLYLEQLPDVSEFSRVALDALRRRIPIVVLTAGTSELGAQVTLSHTSALAGSDALTDVLFERFGVIRVDGIGSFLETLKFLHVFGALPGTRIASASCSGGEAAHIADLAQPRGVVLPELSDGARERLREVLGSRVSVRNPLDYHTYIWGDRVALTACFTALMGERFDCHLLLLDFPRADRCDDEQWRVTVDAFVAAQQATGSRACVLSSLPESLPDDVGRRLVEVGIAPMQGVTDCLTAIAAAARVGAAQANLGDILPVAPSVAPAFEHVAQLDEPAAKRLLAEYGVPVPFGEVATTETAPSVASRIGFPVVVKSVSTAVAHKSDVGAVAVNLDSVGAVTKAVGSMAGLGDGFLVEEMVTDAVVELVVGVRRDPQFGMVLTLGAGGVLVELISDSVSLFLPATRDELLGALRTLRVWPLLTGYRGRSGDVASVVGAVEAVVAAATAYPHRLVEIEVNPLLVLPDRAVAVDVLVRMGRSGND